MKNGLSTMTLDQLLTAALTGQPYNQRRMYDQAVRYARGISMHRARGLQADLHDEIAQQAFADLWQTKAKALVGKTAQEAFRACVLTAIRTVQSDYAPPGQRTRAYKAKLPEKVAPEHIGAPVCGSKSQADSDADAPSLGVLASAMVCDEQTAIEARIDVQTILATASPLMRTALAMVYMDETPLRYVAEEVNLSRFALARKIDQFCLPWRKAA